MNIKNEIRRNAKFVVIAMLASFALSSFASCADDEYASSGVEVKKVMMPNPLIVDSTGVEVTLLGEGFHKGDQLSFVSAVDTASAYTIPVTKANKDSYTFAFPTDFAEGKYNVSLVRGNKQLSLSSNAVEVQFKDSSSPYILEWSDEFNGDKLDLTKWYYPRRKRSDDGRYWTSDPRVNVIKDGTITLRGVVNDFLPSDTAKYLTGAIQSYKDFGFGRYEVRAKLVDARGAWPAIWTVASSGTWPDNGELDIMEHMNYDGFVFQTAHNHYNHIPGNASIYPIRSSHNNTIKKGEFNVYAMDVHDDRVDFFVNDKLTFSYPRVASLADQLQWPYSDHKYVFIIDMQFGGDWVGPIDASTLPAEMTIDYVRFYKFKNE